MDAWQGCRFAAGQSRPALLATASAPIVAVSRVDPIVRNAETRDCAACGLHCLVFTQHAIWLSSASGRPICAGPETPIARQAATARGEGSDGPGAAAQADVDRRQRSPALSGRHLAAAVRATAPRRSRALLRGLAVRALLVGDALRRHLRGRARSRELFVEFGARRYSGRPTSRRGRSTRISSAWTRPATPRIDAPSRRSWRRPTSPISSR